MAKTKRTKSKSVARDMSLPIVSTPADAADLARPTMHVEQETFVVIMLDIRNRIITAPVVVSLGTAHSCEVHPRDVFREAVRHNAAGVVLAHNHPSGDASPSCEDIELTRRLRQAGAILGIPVVDHVVVTTASHVSIHETHAHVFKED